MHKIHLDLSEEEARHLIAVLHVAGFNEKRELPKSLWRNRNDITRNMGRILKHLRKSLESK